MCPHTEKEYKVSDGVKIKKINKELPNFRKQGCLCNRAGITAGCVGVGSLWFV